MSDSVQPIRYSAVTAPATRKGDRGKGAPFTLNDEPPPEPETTGESSDPAPEAHYPEHDIGHKPDDEEGATLDVTG